MRPRLLLFALHFAICNFTNAQNLLRENFNSYITGNDLSGQGSWTNNSSGVGGLGACTGILCSNLKVSGTALTYANYGTSLKSVTVGPDMDNPGIGFTAVSSNSVYVAIMVNYSAATASEGDALRIMGGSNFSTGARIYIKSGSGGFQVGIGKGAGSSYYGVSPATYPFNTTQLLVLKYTFVSGSSNDVVDLFINPNMGAAEPPPTLTINTGSDNVTTVDRLSLRYGASAMPTGNVGGLTVAQSWGFSSTLPASSIRDFQVSRTGQVVDANWVAQEETTISRYELEYATDGKNFTSVHSTVAGAGSYRYRHSINSALNYYRVKVVGIDGLVSYTGIKTVLMKQDAAVITQVKGNGNGRDFNVMISSNNNVSTSIEIFNQLGARVLIQNVTLNKGDNNIQISLASCSTGVYYLRIKDDETGQPVRIIRQ